MFILEYRIVPYLGVLDFCLGLPSLHTCVPQEQQACHTQNTPELLLRCPVPTNKGHSVGVQVSLELCTQRRFKVCRKTKNHSRCTLVLICMCTVETFGAALAGLWNIQRGKKCRKKV